MLLVTKQFASVLQKLLRPLAGRRADLSNLILLYAAAVVTYGLPLVTMPYLARVLGASSYGALLFAQAFGNYVLILTEYGFAFSATRDLARHRESTVKRAEIVAGVFGAKFFLSVVGVMTALIAYWFVPAFRADPRLLLSATIWAIAQASSMLWYFQGMEKIGVIAAIDSVCKTIATLLIFPVVTGPDSNWLALLLPAAGALASTLAATFLVYRQTPFYRPSVALSVSALRTGWSLFLYKGAVSFFTVGNTFILGLVAAPQYVAFFAGGERIAKVFMSLLNPVSQLIYPKLSYLLYHRRAVAYAQGYKIMGFMVAVGIGIGAGVYLFAPLLVGVFLGPGYEPAIVVVQIMSFLGPLIMINSFLGLQWMVPMGMDRPFNLIVLISGIVNISLAVLLATRYHHIGMAIGVVITESTLALMMFVYLRSRRLDPLSVSRVREVDSVL